MVDPQQVPTPVRAWLDSRSELTPALGPTAEPGALVSAARFGRARRGTGPAVTSGPWPIAWLGRVSTDDQQDPVGSLLRQFRVSEAALPPGCVIVARFYDVESGRTDLAARGRADPNSTGLAIPVPRDGSINDLLNEAENPDGCRFVAVICEQIDRVARRTYFGTWIEHRLHAAGVALWAADEHIRAPRAGTAGLAPMMDPTNILTRRVKQGVAEWYALDMIKRAWDGFEVHTDQGYNVGKPPYGFRPVQVRLGVHADLPDGGAQTGDISDGYGHVDHDWADGLNGGVTAGGHRGKGRTGPRTKTRLVPDPVEAQTVRRILTWRITERCGYQGIADRLNRDLTLNPPPTPPGQTRAVGRWTAGSVRDVLAQPKYTGHMVWNRRASKTRRGGHNPVEAWVWSSQLTHEAIVDLDTFVAAQQIGPRRERSRSAPGPNRHPQTARSYLLRSYLYCAGCGRRMFGKTRRDKPYYACAPRKGLPVPDGHPASLWVAEHYLLDGLNEFLNQHVFGAYRRSLLSTTLDERVTAERDEHAQRISAAEKVLHDVDQRRRRLVRVLEVTDDPEPSLLRDVNRRGAELSARHDELTGQLRRLREQRLQLPNPDLIDALPVGACDVNDLPEPLARRLFEALRLEIHYDKDRHAARYRVTLAADTVHVTHQTAATAIASGHRSRNREITQDEEKGQRFPSVMCPRQDSNLRHRSASCPMLGGQSVVASTRFGEQWEFTSVG